MMHATHPAWRLPRGNAICYSGYRRGQGPGEQIYPSIAQIREDLRILSPHWRHLRLYDCSLHAERVLEVLRREKLGFTVMLGAYLGAEVSNPGCPWGAHYEAHQLEANARENDVEVGRLIDLARRYPEIVWSVAVGNEATVDWTDHLVPVPRMIELVRRVKASVPQPVTFCENYVPWHGKLVELAAELDFLSVHTYPVWEGKRIDEALAYTKDNYYGVVARHPGKPVVISEAGWTTTSNGRGIEPHCASQDLQATYCEELLSWASEEGILAYVFEAFDEPWKGSPDPHEPEKHWGLYDVDRVPKRVVRTVFGNGARAAMLGRQHGAMSRTNAALQQSAPTSSD